ncbi:alpha/beta fold hydrolase [Photobacterium damselae]|uniref:alpha/beta fold hydrolase n=1 Tax=Photobacterium damselae TaxID=38293 RepID=UPI001E65D38C|nr:hypothetical protein [Photobacterium damselae]
MKNLLKSVILCGSLLTSLSGCEIVKWKGQYDTHSLKKQGFSEHSLLLKEGGTLNYWQGGQDEPLLLLHGFGGSASATWLATMQELSKHYYVIAPDFIAEQIYDGYFKDWQPERESLLNTLTADRERLGKISTDTLPKTLLIWGDKDQIFPLENGIALSHYL